MARRPSARAVELARLIEEQALDRADRGRRDRRPKKERLATDLGPDFNLDLVESPRRWWQGNLIEGTADAWLGSCGSFEEWLYTGPPVRNEAGKWIRGAPLACPVCDEKRSEGQLCLYCLREGPLEPLPPRAAPKAESKRLDRLMAATTDPNEFAQRHTRGREKRRKRA